MANGINDGMDNGRRSAPPAAAEVLGNPRRHMDGLKNRTMKHPVIAFFVLTYGLSWPLFAVSLFLFPGNMAVRGILGGIATFGPAISGVVVSALSEAGPKQSQGLKRPAVFLFGWLLSGLVMVLFILQVREVPLQVGIIVFSGLLALLPAYVLSCAFSDRAGVRRYLSSLIRPKGHFIWYVVALLTFPVIQLTGYLVTQIMGQEAGELFEGGVDIELILVVVLTYLYGFLFAGGINEESGWRGFAIPHLQATLSPLAASVVVWFFWALWHLLYDMSSGDGVSDILFNRVVFNLLWSVLFVWIFNRTKGSILAPAMFHPAMNTFGDFLPRTHAATGLFTLLTLGVIISDRMWRRLPERRERRCPEKGTL